MGEKGVNNLIETIDLDIKNNEDTINELKDDSFEEKDKYSECSDLIIKIIKKQIETLNLLKETYINDNETDLLKKDTLLEDYGYLMKTRDDLIKIIKSTKVTINTVSKDGTVLARRQVLAKGRYSDLFLEYKEKNESLINRLLGLYEHKDEEKEEQKKKSLTI